MRLFPGNVGWSLYRACEELCKEALDRDDKEAIRVLGDAIDVWDDACKASKPSVRHAHCARRRMAMALAWCVEHVVAD